MSFGRISLPRLSTSDLCLSRFLCIDSCSRSISTLSAGMSGLLIIVSETAFVFNDGKDLASDKTFVVAAATALIIVFSLPASCLQALLEICSSFSKAAFCRFVKDAVFVSTESIGKSDDRFVVDFFFSCDCR